MTQRTRAFVACGILLLGAAAPARAERFTGMKYLGGLPGNQHRQSGTVVVDNGELRFEDRKGRVLFVVPLAAAQAWIGAEKRTTVGSILRSSALMMVAMPLSVGQIDPTQAWSKDKTPVLLVHLGRDTGGTLRWRGPAAQLRAVADAIHQAVRTVDSVPHYDY